MATANAVVGKVYTQEELCLMEEIPEACGIVIFGASGDLTRRKLIPALFKLSEDKILPDACYIVGVARTEMSDAEFRETIEDALKKSVNGGKPLDPKAIKAFAARCSYLSGPYGDAAVYTRLKQVLNKLDKNRGLAGNRIFYFSTPPSMYEVIADQLRQGNLAQRESAGAWVRVVVEKPFGHDLESAMRLTRSLKHVFKENQIYRIDHYLGKESVQNILMFRFANAIYEPVWNSRYIDNIQITAVEGEGVGHRAGYYEQAGVLRDMFQNHLLQLLSLVAMEPPVSMEADAMRNQTAQVIQALKPLNPQDIQQNAVRGQYAGYRQEPGVAPKSSVETFAALKVEVENWRWKGVPFYLRSGKHLAKRVTEIVVQFKRVPSSIFKPLMAEQLSPNVLNFRIQPNDGISLRFQAKHPGPKLCMSNVTMEFNYEEAFGTPAPEAYARLFQDVMLGDQTLFARRDWLHCSWNFLDPLLTHWGDQKEKGLVSYPPGSWGPPEAETLLTRDGRQWLTI